MTAPPTASIVGLGCAVPSGLSTQPNSLRFAIEMAGLTGDAARFAETIYSRSGVASRASVLLESVPTGAPTFDQSFFEPRRLPGELGPTTAARMRAYAALAPPLACAAAERALTDARAFLGERGPAAITHLVIVSCTGFAAPGLDATLIRMLGLSPDVERLSIGFMGCHGGVVGLRTARALALAAPPERPANVLLVCVELCSLHFQYSDRPDQIVANALFGDGAGAVVVCTQAALAGSTTGRSPLTIRSSASRTFPQSEEAMAWIIGDHGFEMTLRESVPDLIRTQLGPWIDAWLLSCGLTPRHRREDTRWAIHPGGPRVLLAVGEALGLSAQSLACSRSILHDHGNMSSPTVLFTVQRLVDSAHGADNEHPIVVVAFGPGLSAEAILLVPQRPSNMDRSGS